MTSPNHFAEAQKRSGEPPAQQRCSAISHARLLIPNVTPSRSFPPPVEADSPRWHHAVGGTRRCLEEAAVPGVSPHSPRAPARSPRPGHSLDEWDVMRVSVVSVDDELRQL